MKWDKVILGRNYLQETMGVGVGVSVQRTCCCLAALASRACWKWTHRNAGPEPEFSNSIMSSNMDFYFGGIWESWAPNKAVRFGMSPLCLTLVAISSKMHMRNPAISWKYIQECLCFQANTVCGCAILPPSCDLKLSGPQLSFVSLFIL